MKTALFLFFSLFITLKFINGQDFKTVKIGNSVWMAENLNLPTRGSWNYNDDPAMGKKYGRLYSWEVAKNVCPAGWHLPTIDEWDKLIENAGGNDIAGKLLKTGGSLGFNAIFAGFASVGNYMLLDSYGGYWSSSSFDDNHAWIVFMTPKDNLVTRTYYTKKYGLSVRCVRNN